MSEEGEGGKPLDNDAPPAWAQTLFKNQESMQKSISDYVELQRQNLTRSQAQQPAPDREEEDLDEAALEALPRSKFAEHIAKKTISHLEKTVIRPLQNQLKQVNETTSVTSLEAAVKDARAEFPDLDNFREPMIALARQHPTLTPRQLYILANPEGGKKKTKEPTEGGKTVTPVKFGGLRPTTGGDGNSKRNTRMDPNEATRTAWDQTVSALGGEPAFEE